MPVFTCDTVACVERSEARVTCVHLLTEGVCVTQPRRAQIAHATQRVAFIRRHREQLTTYGKEQILYGRTIVAPPPPPHAIKRHQ